MKNTFLSIALTISWIFALGQSDPNQRDFEITEGDKTFVMKKYFMCFLKTGPNRTQDKEEANKIQEGHLAHINKLAEEGFVLVAGPFGDDGDIRGILIFDVATKEEALELQKSDPAIISGRLTAEIRPWWTSKEGSFK